MLRALASALLGAWLAACGGEESASGSCNA
jgi:hypothetical protein